MLRCYCVDRDGYLNKNLNPEIIQVSKNDVFWTFLQNCYKNLFIFCMIVEDNAVHHLSQTAIFTKNLKGD